MRRGAPRPASRPPSDPARSTLTPDLLPRCTIDRRCIPSDISRPAPTPMSSPETPACQSWTCTPRPPSTSLVASAVASAISRDERASFRSTAYCSSRSSAAVCFSTRSSRIAVKLSSDSFPNWRCSWIVSEASTSTCRGGRVDGRRIAIVAGTPCAEPNSSRTARWVPRRPSSARAGPDRLRPALVDAPQRSTALVPASRAPRPRRRRAEHLARVDGFLLARDREVVARAERLQELGARLRCSLEEQDPFFTDSPGEGLKADSPRPSAKRASTPLVRSPEGARLRRSRPPFVRGYCFPLAEAVDLDGRPDRAQVEDAGGTRPQRVVARAPQDHPAALPVVHLRRRDARDELQAVGEHPARPPR